MAVVLILKFYSFAKPFICYLNEKSYDASYPLLFSQGQVEIRATLITKSDFQNPEDYTRILLRLRPYTNYFNAFINRPKANLIP